MKDIYLNQTTQASLARSISNPNDAAKALIDEYVLKGLKDYEQVKVNLDSTGFNGLLELMNATTGQPIVTQNKNNSVLAFTALPNTNYVIRVTGKDANITGDYVLNTSSDGTTTASSNTITQVNSTAPNNVMTISDNSIAQAGGSPTGEKSAVASASTLVSSAPSKGVVAPSLSSPIALSTSTGNLNPTTMASSKSSLPIPPIALSLPTVSPPAIPSIGVKPPETIATPATPPTIPAMPPATSITAPAATPPATDRSPAILPVPLAANPTATTSTSAIGSSPATTSTIPAPAITSAVGSTPATSSATTSAVGSAPATSSATTSAVGSAPATSSATTSAVGSAPATSSTTTSAVGSAPVTSSTTSSAIPSATATTTPAVGSATPAATTTTTPAVTNTTVGNTPANIPAIPPSLAIANPSAATTATNTNPVTTSTSNPAPIGGNAITPTATSATFAVGTNNLLNIQNGGAIQFTAGVSSAAFKNEMGAFIVDDEQGRINGILPGAAGYLAAAMSKSQVISAGSRPLDFPAGSRLGFYLVQNGTTTQVKADLAAGKTSTLPVFFQTGNTDGSEHLKVTQSGNNVTFAWEDTIGGGDRDFNDFVVNATLPVNTPISTANAPGAQPTIDLRDISGVKAASVTVGGSSSYDNFIGFYRVDDASGRIDTLNPGDAGYAQAALGRNVILYNKTAGNATPSIEGGGILAPYAIANGTPQSFLDRNPTNQGTGNLPHAYFAFIGANPDKVQHIQLLGDNKFGFEDAFGGGDRDFNDVTAQIRVN